LPEGRGQRGRVSSTDVTTHEVGFRKA
jgi:hypothetical protein